MAKLPFSAKVWMALAAVYVIWGSTYLAIRVGIESMPGLLMAGSRFLIAGAVMYGVGIARGDRRGDRPTARHWANAAVIGTALCLGGNGLVVIAEKRIASGMAALIVATVPLWVAFFEWARFRVALPRAVAVGLAVGFAGTAILVQPWSDASSVDPVGAGMVVGAAAIWAAGSLFARRAALPERPLVSTGMEMLGGGAALMIVATLGGEWGRLDVAEITRSSLIAWVYLIVFGSIVGFTAYVWLLRNVRTSVATTYAYVNPLVAVLLGSLFADEPLTLIAAIAGAVILGSVAIIVRASGGGVRAPEEPDADEQIDLAAKEVPA